MKFVGLTGGIASGKSTVSRILENNGIPIIDADLIAREVVLPGRPAYQLIVKRFGSDVLLPDGNIDRPKLGSIVFADEEKRKILNQCTHPYIRMEILRLFIYYWLTGEKVVVLDAPLLIEGGLDKFVNVVIVVYCSEILQLQRLKARSGLSDVEATQRIRAQIPLSDKARRATYVIDNSGELEETERQVLEIARKIQPSTARWLIEWMGPPVALALIAGWAWYGVKRGVIEVWG